MHNARDTEHTHADNPTIPSRRGLLAGSTAALLAGAAFVTAARAAPVAAAVATGDDAELLSLCAEFHRVHAAVIAARDDDEAQEDAMDERWDVSDEIQHMPATTLAGHRAKAAVAVVLLRENNGGDLCDSNDVDFAFAALREIAGDGQWASEVAATPNPDAALTTMAHEIRALNAESSRLWLLADDIADPAEAERLRKNHARPLIDRESNLRAELATARATTRAGFRAKARVMQEFSNCAPGYADPEQDDALSWSLANDLLGVPSVWRCDDHEEPEA